jgi:hypothetical protein
VVEQFFENRAFADGLAALKLALTFILYTLERNLQLRCNIFLGRTKASEVFDALFIVWWRGEEVFHIFQARSGGHMMLEHVGCM